MKSKNTYPRRKFLEKSSVVGMSMLLGSSYLLSGCTAKEKSAADVVEEAIAEPIHKISVQLYTVRDELNNDIPGTLKKIADLGYKYVETYDFAEDLSFDEVGAMLKENGLSVSSMHGAIPLGEEGEKALRRAKAYDCKQVIWHGWPEDNRYQSLDGIKELAGIYNEANQFLKSNGLEFGLHNHWWELKEKAPGDYPLKHLLGFMDEDIFLEIDTYWVKTAGQDPVEIIAAYNDRVRYMHIKDGPARYTETLGTEEHHEPMVAVGKGTQDFKKIAAACGTDPKWMVVELDECATDIFEALGDSFNFLVSNKLAKAI